MTNICFLFIFIPASLKPRIPDHADLDTTAPVEHDQPSPIELMKSKTIPADSRLAEEELKVRMKKMKKC